ncbi:MAG: glycoside hydrolase family 15 protein, partial [Lysobacterales bacterium]
MNISGTNAPGWPGIEPRWTSSMKSGVGTATSASSQVWFTLSHGILNEIYYPAVDTAATRDFGLLVSGADGFVSEEKRETQSRIEALDAGVPAFRLVSRCNQGRYVITKTVISDPLRDVVLQRIRFHPLIGEMGDYKVYALLSPHLNNSGWGNTGWVGDYKGQPMLFAEHEHLAMALGSSIAPVHMSCGYVGRSDGWTDLSQNRSMQWSYTRAENGNIALTAEFDPAACGGEFTLALGFGRSVAQAGQKARASLLENFDEMVESYVGGWRVFHAGCLEHSCPERNGFDVYRVSPAVLRTHESKQYPGAMIASLSIPWGSTRSDRDLGGYHLVWSRDLVESAGGLLASGDIANARQTLLYLMSTQEADGHWPQNMWLSGESFWGGIQADETAFFILLADALRRAGELGSIDPYPAVKSACQFLIATGPSTGQDRWEENAGYTCFTLAVEIAALLAAADLAEEQGHAGIAAYLRESADSWNDIVDPLTYVRGTPLARQLGVDGYYLRIAPPECVPGDDVAEMPITIRNRPAEEAVQRAGDIVSVDALALVRFGLRAPDDPKILNTLKV